MIVAVHFLQLGANGSEIGNPAPDTSAEGERPWMRSFHTHSAPYKCVTVSRTELKLEPRLRVNCSW